MKTSISQMILIVTLLFSCKNSSNNTNDLGGTYVTQFNNEYTITNDTLIITPAESSSKSFNVERRTGFNKIRDGVTLDKQFKVAKWMSFFDSDKQVLKETDLGKQIHVVSGTDKIRLGSSEYTKIN